MRKRVPRTALVAIILLTILLLGPSGVLADDTDWKDPTADYAFSGGGFDFPDNAYHDDAADAEADFDGSGGTKEHVYKDYDLGIPACATIDGIEVQVDYCPDIVSAGDNHVWVYLSPNGGTNWSAPQEALYTSDCPTKTLAIVGGDGDDWGMAWTPAILNSGDFEVRVVAETDT
jgi:hypothetical protein